MVDNNLYDYFSSLDRMGADYFVEPSFKKTLPNVARDSPIRNPANTGMGVGPGINGKNITQTVQSEIRGGANRVEITMFGHTHGNAQRPTFDMVDKRQREEIRALQELNDFDVVTHASPGVFGLAGFNQQEGGFSDAKFRDDFKEVKQAINFAADTTRGGTVVVHSGDFPRSISYMRGDGQGKFEAYEGEAEESTLYVVDGKTGKLAPVKTDDYIVRAKYARDASGNIIYHKDSEGNKAVDDIKFEYLYKKHGFSSVEEARKHVNEKRFADAWIPEVEYDKSGNIQTEDVGFNDYYAEWKKEHGEGSAQDAAVDFFKDKQRVQLNNALGTAHYYEEMYKRSHEQLSKIHDSLAYYKEKKKEMGEEAFRAKFGRHVGGGEYISGDFKDPIQILEEQLISVQKNMDQGRETSVYSRSQARELLRNLDNFKGIEDYGVKKSAEGFAKAALYAYDKTNEMKKRRAAGEEGAHLFKKPISIAIENVFPEQYGATPDEILHLVNKTRAEFKEALRKQRGIKDEKELDRLAKQHVGVTMDTGHLFMWRKYYKEDPSKTPEQNEAGFQEWYKEQVQKFAASGDIANLHIADNFGYEDTHMTVGQGAVPMDSVMEILAKHDVDAAMAVEGGYDGERGLFEMWRLLGSPVYGVESGYVVDQQHATHFNSMAPSSYSGFASTPLSVVGSYLPSEDWKIWTEIPFE